MSNKILYAEDEKRDRELLVARLKKALPALEIIAVENGAEFVREARTNVYVAGITDNRMPQKSGLEAVAELRAEGSTLPICVLSYDGNPDFIRKAGEAGATRFVMKGSGDINALVEYLRPYLENSAAAE